MFETGESEREGKLTLAGVAVGDDGERCKHFDLARRACSGSTCIARLRMRFRGDADPDDLPTRCPALYEVVDRSLEHVEVLLPHESLPERPYEPSMVEAPSLEQVGAVPLFCITCIDDPLSIVWRVRRAHAALLVLNDHVSLAGDGIDPLQGVEQPELVQADAPTRLEQLADDAAMRGAKVSLNDQHSPPGSGEADAECAAQHPATDHDDIVERAACCLWAHRGDRVQLLRLGHNSDSTGRGGREGGRGRRVQSAIVYLRVCVCVCLSVLWLCCILQKEEGEREGGSMEREKERMGRCRQEEEHIAWHHSTRTWTRDSSSTCKTIYSHIYDPTLGNSAAS